MFEPRQRQQHARRDGRSATAGGFGKALGTAAVDGLDEGRPGKRLRPLTDGMRMGHNIGNLEVRTTTGQPRLEMAEETHGQLSCALGIERLRICRYDPRRNPILNEANKVVATTYEDVREIHILAVGVKLRNKVYIGGEEYDL